MRMLRCVRFVSDRVFDLGRQKMTIDVSRYVVSSRDRTRTGTGVPSHWILSRNCSQRSLLSISLLIP